jgi:hypothetical protein
MSGAYQCFNLDFFVSPDIFEAKAVLRALVGDVLPLPRLGHVDHGQLELKNK